MTDFFEGIRVIDVDTHLTEPPDLWTSRIASKWGDLIPHVERRGDEDCWVIGDRVVLKPGIVSMAGFDGTVPDHPATYDDFPRLVTTSMLASSTWIRTACTRKCSIPTWADSVRNHFCSSTNRA